jgi:ribA/ribD-fused uncharacterized protein
MNDSNERVRRSHNGCIVVGPMIRPYPTVAQFADESKPITLFFGAGSFLSNHYKSKFKYGKREFESVEQAYFWFKAKFFGDRRVATEILTCRGPLAARKLCNTIQTERCDLERWAKVADNYMRLALRQKFYSDGELAAELLATNLSYIAYGDVCDLYWGIGLGLYDSDAFDRKCWKGLNHLGRLLMTLRTELRSKLSKNRLQIPCLRACIEQLDMQSKFPAKSLFESPARALARNICSFSGECERAAEALDWMDDSNLWALSLSYGR